MIPLDVMLAESTEFFICGATVPSGVLLTVQAARSHSNTPQSVRLLWTSDKLVAETST
jgi:hypothetical protein